MQEYLISFQGIRQHFFYKSGYGLCFRKKEGARFSDFEILLKEAEDDFCVCSLGQKIHIACQDHSGAILYLRFDGEKWEKLTLLEAKVGKASPKHFFLIPIGSYLNLFYTIPYQERTMLVHQILGAPNREPTVVDYITPSAYPFSVSSHSSTDLALCYQNMQGVYGLRDFQWSQKKYRPFVPLLPGLSVSSVSVFLEEDDTAHFAALLQQEATQDLIYFRREASGAFTKPITVYRDCAASPGAVFRMQEQKLCLEWLTRGGVMLSVSEDSGETWKDPIRYLRSAASEPILFRFCQNGKFVSYYGTNESDGIRLYSAETIPSLKSSAPHRYHPEGYDAKQFAQKFGYDPEKESREEALRLQLDEQERRIAALSVRMDRLEEKMTRLTARESTTTVKATDNSSAKLTVTAK